MKRYVALAGIVSCALLACDTYFLLDGHVVRCSDQDPLVGVRATLTLTGGGVSDDEESQFYTNPNGDFFGSLNEPPNVAATLRLEKPGYRVLTRAYDEAPDGVQQFCLEEDPTTE